MSQGLGRVFTRTGRRSRALSKGRRIKFRLYFGAGLFFLGVIISVISLIKR